MTDGEFQSCMQQLDALLQEVDAMSDPAARTATSRVIGGLLDFHGAALARLTQRLEKPQLEKIAEDELVSSLLLLHTLHPHDMPTRIESALAKLRRNLGKKIEFVDLSPEGVVRIIIRGHCCSSSAASVEAAITQTIYEYAPEVAEVRVEKEEQQGSSGFVPLEQVIKSAGRNLLRQGATP